MTDIVEQLRTHDFINWAEGMEEAADEIERTRAALAERKCVVTGCGMYDGGEMRRLRAERDALRELLRRVLSCGLNEEPHGVGFTPSRQERKAGELARDIEAALGGEKS